MNTTDLVKFFNKLWWKKPENKMRTAGARLGRLGKGRNHTSTVGNPTQETTFKRS